jgi:3-dehydroquinate synthase
MGSSTRETTTGRGEPVLLRFSGSERHCPVTVGQDARLTLPRTWRGEWRRAAIIGDATVLALHGEELAGLLRRQGVDVELLPFPAGEAHKTRATKEQLEDRLSAAGLERGGCIVALGGGLSLDLAGFVAATYLRGVAHVNVPTSLLAMVDAAIGGKTGVNTARGKNLIGAIHQPIAVLVDPHYLATLPAAQWPAGLAELVKHAVIADAHLFEWIEAHAAALLGPPWRQGDYPLRRCVEIKGEIVQRDEREQGLRSLLNYGHTVGHALEKATGHELDHGRAVAIGMALEGRVAVELCGFPGSELARLRALLERLGLPIRPPADLSLEDLAPFLATDKKRQDGELRLALPERIGQMAAPKGRFTVPAPRAALERAWQEASA